MIGVTFDARPGQSVPDFNSLMGFIRANAGSLGVDPNRVAIWSCASGTPHAVQVANQEGSTVRGLVVYYGGIPAERDVRSDLPMLVVLAGQDTPANRTEVVNLGASALAANAPLAFLNYPDGQRGFDILNDNEQTRKIVRSTLDFFQSSLTGAGQDNGNRIASSGGQLPSEDRSFGEIRPAPAGANVDLRSKANTSFQNGDWNNAANLYALIYARDPGDLEARFKPGLCRHPTQEIRLGPALF